MGDIKSSDARNAAKSEREIIVFDSYYKAVRYKELQKAEARGLISKLRVNAQYNLIPTRKVKINGKVARQMYCIVDFVYMQGGEEVCEAVCDGLQISAKYQLDKEFAFDRYGILIQEA